MEFKATKKLRFQEVIEMEDFTLDANLKGNTLRKSYRYSKVYHILLLEDDRQLSQMIGKMLTREEFSLYGGRDTKFVVHRAYTYDEAVSIASMIKIDIFILDVYLSKVKDDFSFFNKSGLDFAKRLKEGGYDALDRRALTSHISYQYGTPIIFLTSETNVRKRVAISDEIGPHIFLEKPANEYEIISTVEMAVYGMAPRFSQLNLVDVDDQSAHSLEPDEILWGEIGPSTVSLHHYAKEKRKQPPLRAHRRFSAQKSAFAIAGGCIDGIVGYVINPTCIKGYDDETNELIVEYISDYKIVPKKNGKPPFTPKIPRHFKVIKEEARIPIPKKNQEVMRIIAQRSMWYEMDHSGLPDWAK